MDLCTLQVFQVSSEWGMEKACIQGIRTTEQHGKCRSAAFGAGSKVTDVGDTEKDL